MKSKRKKAQNTNISSRVSVHPRLVSWVWQGCAELKGETEKETETDRWRETEVGERVKKKEGRKGRKEERERRKNKEKKNKLL